MANKSRGHISTSRRITITRRAIAMAYDMLRSVVTASAIADVGEARSMAKWHQRWHVVTTNNGINSHIRVGWRRLHWSMAVVGHVMIGILMVVGAITLPLNATTPSAMATIRWLRVTSVVTKISVPLVTSQNDYANTALIPCHCRVSCQELLFDGEDKHVISTERRWRIYRRSFAITSHACRHHNGCRQLVSRTFVPSTRLLSDDIDVVTATTTDIPSPPGWVTRSHDVDHETHIATR